MVALGKVSATTRESDLAEADRLSAVASSLRAGSASRAAVESEASALRAKWPDFSDDAEGQVMRLGAFLLSRGLAREDVVPARAIIAHISTLEAAQAQAPAAGGSCHGCGLPQGQSGPTPINTFLMEAVKSFETDANFRDQVKSGEIKPGQQSHPWIPGSAPHRGPGIGPSPWALSTLATMVRNDPHAIKLVGPQLRSAFRDRGLAIPDGFSKSAPQLNGRAAN
jgi:hypothetical protein